MKPAISEIIKLAAAERTKGKKIAVLLKYDSVALRRVLKFIFDENLVKLLPEVDAEGIHIPEWKAPPSMGTEMMMYNESRRLRIFVEGGGYDTLSPLKREMLFIGMLEAIHVDDAWLLIEGLKAKPKIGIGSKIIYEAFPTLNETTWA